MKIRKPPHEFWPHKRFQISLYGHLDLFVYRPITTKDLGLLLNNFSIKLWDRNTTSSIRNSYWQSRKQFWWVQKNNDWIFVTVRTKFHKSLSFKVDRNWLFWYLLSSDHHPAVMQWTKYQVQFSREWSIQFNHLASKMLKSLYNTLQHPLHPLW